MPEIPLIQRHTHAKILRYPFPAEPVPSYAAPMSRTAQGPDVSERLPPQAFFLVSAVFHYLGPSLAVLLFAHVDVLGVAWLRIASAALGFALWRRPLGVWGAV